ncbi:sensor histidine kinase [Hyalangium rubrum]|uniref:histidine kinase n=1 Tax=Hyalangium rubrum TaxID=3103134 RepID=A0ABU5HDQ0_9BACT|nr:ATP-binding protein [Hyalangium sp. s54d21]MDY7231587.1 ATP-binding protein [Hyalangium sp. s54d21]
MALLEGMSDAFFAIDRDWRFTYVNAAAERMLRKPREQLLGCKLWDEYPEALGTSFELHYRRAMAENVSSRFEEFFAPLAAWFEVQVHPSQTGISVFFDDITTRKSVEEALRQETALVEALNRTGQTLAAELDLERLVQLLTDEATRLTGARFGAFFYNVLNDEGQSYMLYTLSGVPRESFEGFPMPRKTDIFRPTFDGERPVRLADVTKDPRYGQNRPYHGMPKGHLPVRSYLAGPVKARSGEVLGGLFFGHPETDVFTERHERILLGIASQAAIAIENARLYQKQLDAVRQRDEFLTVASHELKTPLTSLQLQLQLIARGLHAEPPVSGSRQEERLERAQRQIQRLANLVDSLLDVSQVAERRLELSREPVDLARLVQDTVDMQRESFVQAGCDVLLKAEQPVWGEWDGSRLEQVLTHLLDNAAKYGSGQPVEVAVNAEGEQAVVTVSDRGIGIASEDLERIFSKFERAVPVRNYGGLGLGLYLTREIVRAHGGTVSVRSRRGEGATFEVRLPRIM